MLATRNGQPTQTVQPESFVWTSSTFSWTFLWQWWASCAGERFKIRQLRQLNSIVPRRFLFSFSPNIVTTTTITKTTKKPHLVYKVDRIKVNQSWLRPAMLLISHSLFSTTNLKVWSRWAGHKTRTRSILANGFFFLKIQSCMWRHFQFARAKSLEVFIPLMEKSLGEQCSYCKQTDLTSKNCFATRKSQVCKVKYYCLKLRVESFIHFLPAWRTTQKRNLLGRQLALVCARVNSLRTFCPVQ